MPAMMRTRRRHRAGAATSRADRGPAGSDAADNAASADARKLDRARLQAALQDLIACRQLLDRRDEGRLRPSTSFRGARAASPESMTAGGLWIRPAPSGASRNDEAAGTTPLILPRFLRQA